MNWARGIALFGECVSNREQGFLVVTCGRLLADRYL